MKPSAITVLQHLKTGKSISGLEALHEYGNFRLADSIWILRSAGWPITKEMIKQEGEGSGHYARYSLDQDRSLWPDKDK
jgi:hypothetical protein